MDLALNNLQRLICHKTKQTKPNHQKRSFRGAKANRKLTGISVLNIKVIYCYIYEYCVFNVYQKHMQTQVRIP